MHYMGLEGEKGEHVLLEFRWLLALRGHIMKGLRVLKDGVSRISDNDLERGPADMKFEEFMEIYRFSGVNDESCGTGWTPLRFASLHDSGLGMATVIKTLIGKGAAVEAPLDKAYPRISHAVGHTILQSASMLSSANV